MLVSMTPWGLAIRALLKQAKRSRRKAASQHLAPYSAFSQWQRCKRGPNVATLDRLLRGLGLTWQDWADAFERAKAAIGDQRRRRGIHAQKQHPITKIDRQLKANELRIARASRRMDGSL
jgi:hypothetical protein